jgi:predicted nuclease of restriction endonuclease-like (RecB) superfamily
VSGLLEEARRSAARTANAELTTTYWLIGKRLKDSLVLELLGLKNECSEAELEDALIRGLEQFLLELGNDFAFSARKSD